MPRPADKWEAREESRIPMQLASTRRLDSRKRKKASTEAIKCRTFSGLTQKAKPNKPTKSFRLGRLRKNEAKTKPLSALNHGIG